MEKEKIELGFEKSAKGISATNFLKS